MAGRYKAYPEYKNSELKWLGFVPTSWTVSKFAYLKTVLTDYTANGSFADLKKNVTYLDEPDFARLVRLTDLRRNLDNDGVWIDETSYKYLSKSALFGGEFLLANVGAYAGLFYQMPYNKGFASLAPNMFMAKFDSSKVLPDFMAYVGQSNPINKQLTLNATASSAQPKLNKDDFKSIRFCYPSLIEQQKIANFNDTETTKIDTLINKQEKLIELLKEKRQAVISHAVTKGLPSVNGEADAPMKDSGVEWLGEVPEHWDVSSIKYVSSFVGTGGTPKKSSSFSDENEVKWFTPGDFNDDLEITEASKHITNDSVVSGDVKTYKKDSVLVIGIGATLGKVSFCKDSFSCNQQINVITPNRKALGKFIAFSLLAQLEQMKQSSNASTIGIMNQEKTKAIQIALAPLQEQEQVVSYVEQKLSRFKELNLQANLQIDLLKERKTALISAAVTGKIDVRDWKPQGV